MSEQRKKQLADIVRECGASFAIPRKGKLAKLATLILEIREFGYGFYMIGEISHAREIPTVDDLVNMSENELESMHAEFWARCGGITRRKMAKFECAMRQQDYEDSTETIVEMSKDLKTQLRMHALAKHTMETVDQI